MELNEETPADGSNLLCCVAGKTLTCAVDTKPIFKAVVHAPEASLESNSAFLGLFSNGTRLFKSSASRALPQLLMETPTRGIIAL